MNLAALAWIAAGGALGSVARAGVGWLLPADRFPWATLVVNVVGSLAIGWMMARLGPATGWDSRGYAFVVVGLCGGFTTFSTFSWQTFEQMQKGAWLAAGANVLLSVGLCLLATWAGWRLGR